MNNHDGSPRAGRPRHAPDPNNATALWEMHEITTAPRLTFAEQIRGILEIGVRRFGLSSAAVSKVEGERLETVHVTSRGGEIAEGTVLELCDTFCQEVVRSGRPLAIPNVSESEWNDHPAHEKLGLESYLSSPVQVAGKSWGTLCFFDFQPRAREFTSSDMDLLRLLAERIQVELERQAVEQGLRSVLEGTSGGTGDSLFRSMVRHLADALGVRYAFVTECLDPEGTRARMLAIWWDGEPGTGKVYETGGTPCGLVLREGVQYYPNGVRLMFPDAADLIAASAEGFVGVPMRASTGRILGHLAAMDSRRIDLDLHQRWILEIFAARAAAEIERMRAERRARAREERYQLATRAGGVGVWDLDVETGRLVFDTSVKDLLGLDDDEIPEDARAWREFVHPDDRDRVTRAIGDHIKGVTPRYETEHRMVRKDGTIRWVEVRGDAVRDEDGRAVRVAGTRIDITERRRLEDEQRDLERLVVHSEKLKSLGVLAGGIAHDFNNLLTGILGHASLALEELPEESRTRTRIEKIKAVALRAENLTRQMLAYSGRGAFVVKPVDLNTLVKEMSELLDTAVSGSAELRCEFESELSAIEADESQLRQVVMNLIMNGSDALDGQPGLITLRTGSENLAPGQLANFAVGESLAPGPHVFVDSAIGRGTRVRVAFPASDKSVVVEVPPIGRPSRKMDGTVLVVDDEQTVRDVVRALLEAGGLSVLTANDGVEGVELFRRHGDEIDVVLMDLTMPRLDGCSAAREILEHDAETPVLLMSGYDERDALKRFSGDGLSGFVRKPFVPAELLERIQAVLHQS